MLSWTEGWYVMLYVFEASFYINRAFISIDMLWWCIFYCVEYFVYSYVDIDMNMGIIDSFSCLLSLIRRGWYISSLPSGWHAIHPLPLPPPSASGGVCPSPWVMSRGTIINRHQHLSHQPYLHLTWGLWWMSRSSTTSSLPEIVALWGWPHQYHPQLVFLILIHQEHRPTFRLVWRIGKYTHLSSPFNPNPPI